jgi:hypothetical protein
MGAAALSATVSLFILRIADFKLGKIQGQQGPQGHEERDTNVPGFEIRNPQSAIP